jgi:serine/threonine protein kinase
VPHPHIVPIYAHGATPSGVPYLVMEYVEGKSLRELIPDGPITPVRTARLLTQLASALAAIHKKNIFHRDVKPENLMIRNLKMPSEEIVLIDFSISLVKNANETLHGISRAAGSFDYMAPEQAIGYARPSTDIYSLSKVLIEILTGKRLAVLLPGASMDLPLRVRELLLTLPVHFSQASIGLISASLEFDPSHRPQEILHFVAPIVADLQSQPRIM